MKSTWLVRALYALLAAALTTTAFAQGRNPPDPDALVALLRAGNIAELDSRVGAYQAAYEAGSDAEWDAIILFSGFERVDPDLEAAFDAWVKARPRSYGALVARGAYFYQRAWSSRGGRFAAETAGERLGAMQRLFERAERDFQEALRLSPRPQLGHRYLIGIAMARGDAAAARRWYEDALGADPENYASRRGYLNALRPEWGGSLDAMQALVNEAAALPATPKLRAVVQHMKASAIGRVALEAQRAKDYPAALELYAKGLAEAEDAILLNNRGWVLVQTGRHDEALRDLDRSIELDPTEGEALSRRGNLHERRKRIKEAVRDYARAASYGDTYAMQRLGILYFYGKDVPLNYAEAAKWLQLGAAYGEPRAQATLGWMYSAGAGVPQDGRKAIALWRLAAAQGNEDARKNLEGVPWWWHARYAVEDLFSRFF